jgi:hypothetical protein
MKTRQSIVASAAMLAAQAVTAQHAGALRPDAVEAQRSTAMASILGKSHTARSKFEPLVLRAAPGSKSCEINIGDVQSGRSDDAAKPLGESAARKGLARFTYVTVVEASPICVTR